MGFLIPFAAFAISVGTLLVWGFRDKRKYRATHGGSVAPRPRKAA
jgi:hypothetical protein